MSFWFPRLKEAGLPVPATTIVEMSQECVREVWEVLERGGGGKHFQKFIADLTNESELHSAPFFLRSGETSAKHYWKETCFVRDNLRLREHVLAIAEFCVLAGVIGLPFNVWAIRELLPTRPAFHAFAGELPITEEWRVFVDGDRILCVHPYWPEAAILRPSEENWKERLGALYEQGAPNRVRVLAICVGLALAGNAWSVDILKSDRGWYVIDVALAHMSWHDECENDFKRRQ